MQEQLYGRAGQATANYLNAPCRFQSKNTRWEFNVDKASEVLDHAGWKRGADGIRAKDGKRLKFVSRPRSTRSGRRSRPSSRRAATKAGIEMELKSVVASVFFGSDEATRTPSGTSAPTSRCTPGSSTSTPSASMRVFASWEVPPRRTSWSGRNTTRWRNEEYDRLYKAAETEMDPVKRAAHFIRMNDLVVQSTRRHPARLAELGVRRREQAEGHRDQRLGLELLEPSPLVPGSLASGGRPEFGTLRVLRHRRRGPAERSRSRSPTLTSV